MAFSGWLSSPVIPTMHVQLTTPRKAIQAIFLEPNSKGLDTCTTHNCKHNASFWSWYLKNVNIMYVCWFIISHSMYYSLKHHTECVFWSILNKCVREGFERRCQFPLFSCQIVCSLIFFIAFSHIWILFPHWLLPEKLAPAWMAASLTLNLNLVNCFSSQLAMSDDWI